MTKATDTAALTSPEYRQFIEDLKIRVVSARLSAARVVNSEAILLYWDIGQGIVEKQNMLGWGESVIEQVSRDLRAAFPGSTGYSARNLRSAKQLYLTYSDPAIWLQPVAKLARRAGEPAIWLQPVAKLNSHTVIDFLRQLSRRIAHGMGHKPHG
jgi:hypothetical protein